MKWVGLCVLVGLGVVVTRVFWDGRAALAEGDAAVARGDVPGAIERWRRAARWYAPGAGHVEAAYERLEALAREAEGHADRATALEAWRAIRSSILATRSFYTPFPTRLEAANQRIAALMAEEEVAADAKKDAAERRGWHLALLEKDESPSLPWTLLALSGFAAWVGGGFWFARRGVTAEDKLDRRTAIRSGLLVAVGLLAWMLGLYKA
jgi:hypothetical protein